MENEDAAERERREAKMKVESLSSIVKTNRRACVIGSLCVGAHIVSGTLALPLCMARQCTKGCAI